MIKILNKWMEPDEYANQSQKDRQDTFSLVFLQIVNFVH